MMRVLACGQLNTVQDLGRLGQRAIGVGTAGAMDQMAFVLGNRLVGNPPGFAGIELTLPPFRVRFARDTLVALTGADFQAELDGVRIPAWSGIKAQTGQRLEITRPPCHGARGYLCVQGGINVPTSMGSRSTDLKGAFGGFQGRGLQKGDRIYTQPGEYAELWATNPYPTLSSPPYGLSTGLADFTRDACLSVRVLPAAEYAWMDQASQETFWDAEWTITPASNRMGYRLAGPSLAFRAGSSRELMSHGILNGVIQLPPSRQPIIQLHDSNTVGGYPKIGGVISADLRVLAQAPLGARIRFVQVDYEKAVQALRQEKRLMVDQCAHIASLLPRQSAAAGPAGHQA